jgi:hypothetical protein
MTGRALSSAEVQAVTDAAFTSRDEFGRVTEALHIDIGVAAEADRIYEAIIEGRAVDTGGGNVLLRDHGHITGHVVAAVHKGETP